MPTIWKHARNIFVSLKLTVFLLVLAMLLVFFATIDQVNLGVWTVQHKWFHSFFVCGIINGISVPLFPGGYLIGGLLFLNLVAAHVYRFRFSPKKIGIILAHFGLLLLLVGEFFSGLWQEDYKMSLNVGQASAYAESFHYNELAITDISATDHDTVTSIPETLLTRSQPIQFRSLPFRVIVRGYFPNAVPQMRDQLAAMNSGVMLPPPIATAGVGSQMVVVPFADSGDGDSPSTPAAYIELAGVDGKSLGIWLLSPALGTPQTITYQGKTWSLALRPKRLYAGFSLQLLSVTNDFYPGSDIPKNFASRVILREGSDTTGREVTVFMNNPLRHGGLTFYQYQMAAASGNSVFQVVRNPTWTMPYFACALTALGLLVQFCTGLVLYIGKRHVRSKTAGGAAQPEGQRT